MGGSPYGSNLLSAKCLADPPLPLRGGDAEEPLSLWGFCAAVPSSEGCPEGGVGKTATDYQWLKMVIFQGAVLDQPQGEQNFGQHALPGVVPTPLAVEQATLEHQAIDQDD